jgi:hypothetical protein
MASRKTGIPLILRLGIFRPLGHPERAEHVHRFGRHGPMQCANSGSQIARRRGPCLSLTEGTARTPSAGAGSGRNLIYDLREQRPRLRWVRFRNLTTIRPWVRFSSFGCGLRSRARVLGREDDADDGLFVNPCCSLGLLGIVGLDGCELLVPFAIRNRGCFSLSLSLKALKMLRVLRYLTLDGALVPRQAARRPRFKRYGPSKHFLLVTDNPCRTQKASGDSLDQQVLQVSDGLVVLDEPARNRLVLGSIFFPLFPRGEESVGVKPVFVCVLTRPSLPSRGFRWDFFPFSRAA